MKVVDLYEKFVSMDSTKDPDVYAMYLNRIQNAWDDTLTNAPSTIIALEELLERMCRDFEDGNVGTSEENFRKTFIDAYELLNEVHLEVLHETLTKRFYGVPHEVVHEVHVGCNPEERV